MSSIVMVAACPFPANYGSPASIRELSEILAARGHNVHVVTYPFGQPLSVGRARVWRAPYWRKQSRLHTGPSWEKLLLDFLLLIRLCRVVRRERIDIIHAHNYEGVLIGILCKFLTRRPLVYQAVNLMEDELPSYSFIRPAILARGIARLLDWIVAIFPDFIVAITNELRDHFLDQGFPPARLAVIPPGINPEMFDSADPQRFRALHSVGSRPLVVYTGVTNRFQRIDYLLKAFCLVCAAEPQARLMIVSPLEAERDLPASKELAQSLGIGDRVIWVEGHPLVDLPDYLAAADVTVVPRPDMPGYPLKLLNYMAMGKPTVCFSGAAKGVRDLYDALVVPDHDYNEMGRAILRLLQDPELARSIGENAQRTVETSYTWKSLCTKMETVYYSLVGDKATRQPFCAHNAANFGATALNGSQPDDFGTRDDLGLAQHSDTEARPRTETT